MSIGSFVGDHTMLLGIAMVGGFVVWKFLLEPIMNEGQPLEPTEENIKTFGEKMAEQIQPGTNL